MSLDARWDVIHVGQDEPVRPVEVRRIEVPGPWQAQFADLRMRAGTGVYRRTVEIPARWKYDRIFLRFGAVVHLTKVWLNGAHVGTHEGGFLPYSFDVTGAPVEPDGQAETPFAEVPFGSRTGTGRSPASRSHRPRPSDARYGPDAFA